jgi:hypothetical protein
MEWSRVLDFNIEKKWIQVLTLEVEKLTYKSTIVKQLKPKYTCHEGKDAINWIS